MVFIDELCWRKCLIIKVNYYHPQQKGLSKNIKIKKGRNRIFKTIKNSVPNIPKIKANIAKTKAKTNAKGVKANTKMTKSNFKPSISKRMAMKISMIVL
jgi:hypothetical protein